MAQPPVSIILTPRDQYGMAPASLRSVFAGLPPRVKVLFVAGKGSEWLVPFLKKTAERHKNFSFVLSPGYLSANQARNTGLRKIRTGDVVFVENDVVVRRGWLAALLQCAKETGADIVAPLVLEGDPAGKAISVHTLGGDFIAGKKNVEYFMNRVKLEGQKPSRRRLGVVEYHCLWLRRSFLNRIVFDEGFGNLSPHIDLSLRAKELGAKVFVEPKARVVFANPAQAPLRLRGDFEFFVHQWGEKASGKFISRAAERWGMDPRGKNIRAIHQWSLWNKELIFATFGVLTAPELLFWKAARLRLCPSWAREALEKYLVWRILAGFHWRNPAV